MSDELGWIKIHRKIKNNPVYNNAELFHLFIHCLLSANHKKKTIIFNGKPIEIKTGQFITGRFQLAGALNQKPKTVYNRLQILKNLGILDIKTNNKFSLITVLNYNTYQSQENQKGQQKGQPEDNQRTTRGQPEDTNKNDKKEKNEKKSEKNAEDVEKIINNVLLKYNSFAIRNKLPKCLKVTGDRRANLIDRLQEPEFNIDHILTGVKNSEWLLKKQDPKFNIDFIISSDNNYIKILEGKFNAEKNKTFKNGFNSSKNGEGNRRNGNTAGGFGIGTNATGNQQAERKPDIVV